MVRVDVVLADKSFTIAEQGLKGFEITGATTHTELNQISSAKLTIPNTNTHANAIVNSISPVVNIYEDEQICFAGSVAKFRQNIYGEAEIELDGPMSWLSDIVKAPFYVTTLSHYDYIKRIIDQYNAAMTSEGTEHRAVWFGGVDGFSGVVNISHSDEYVRTLDLLREAVDLYGGYIYENFGGGAAHPAVGWVKSPIVNSGKTLEFGVNVRSLTDDLDFSDYASRVYGKASNGLTVTGGYLIDTAAEERYGRRDFAFTSNSETQAEIDAEAGMILGEHSIPIKSIELTAAEMERMNHSYRTFSVGTTATAIDRGLGINIEMIVNSVDRDLINRQNSAIGFGRSPVTISSVVARL